MSTNATPKAKPTFAARARGAAQRVTNLRVYDRRDLAAQQADILGDKSFMELYAKCQPFTMTSPERMYSLHQAAEFVAVNKVPGAFVETGVWRGGCSMLTAFTLMARGDRDRDLWLYDTYEGMAQPGKEDLSWDGKSAEEMFEATPEWCAASLDDVRTNMHSTGYPAEHLHFIEGKVEETIPQAGLPDQIALLRMDTDWYSSSKHELEHLYPRLVSGGVLLIDDYGYWAGARKAVDEYFAAHSITGLLSRVDNTARMMIKP